jgi:hypothetical protein
MEMYTHATHRKRTLRERTKIKANPLILDLKSLGAEMPNQSFVHMNPAPPTSHSLKIPYKLCSPLIPPSTS